MAQGTFQLIGAVVGSAFGPIGSFVGSYIGGLVDQEVFGKGIKGPRLESFHVTGSEAGAPMARVYGSYRLPGEIIWFGRIREKKKTKKKGGIAGFGGTKVTTYTYFATLAIGICEGPDVCLKRIRINGKVWWEDGSSVTPEYTELLRRVFVDGIDSLSDAERDEYNETTTLLAQSAGRSDYFQFYSGAPDQSVDPTIASYLGDQAPAYRDTSHVVFNELPITEWGGVLPAIEFDVVKGSPGDETTAVVYKAQEIVDWQLAVDPRIVGRDASYEYKYHHAGPYRDTLQEALEDAAADLGKPFDPSRIVGWRFYSSASADDIDALNEVYPAESIVTDFTYFQSRQRLILHVQSGDSLDGDPCGSGVSCCEAYRVPNGRGRPAVIISNDEVITSSSGTILDPSGLNGQDLVTVENVLEAATLEGNAFLPVPGYTWAAPVLIGTTYVNGGSSTDRTGDLRYQYRQLAYLPDGRQYNGEHRFYITAYCPDVAFIDIRRKVTCPQTPCERADAVTLPENADFCVVDGNVYPDISFGTTSDGTFLQLQEYGVTPDASGNTVKYPLGPVLNLDNEADAERNTEEFWTEAYESAVADGKMASGLVYGIHYPVTPEVVCEAPLSHVGPCTEADTTVGDIVEAECIKRGLTANDVDVSRLTDPIRGFGLLQNMAGRDAIEQLRVFSWFDAVNSDGRLKFVPRGDNAVATLTLDELGAHEYGQTRPPAFEVTRADDKQLPREIRVNYIDQDNDFQPGQQYDRRQIVDTTSNSEIPLAIVMSGSRGKQAAVIALYDQWAARKALQFSLGPKWLLLEPTDVVFIPDLESGDYTRVRIDTDDLALPGLRSLQAVRDEQSLYGREASGPTPQLPPDRNPTSQGPTTTVVMDLNRLGANDDDAGYWLADYGTLAGWNGSTDYRSIDGGATYDEVSSGSGATAGMVETLFDGASMVVKVYNGELLSATPGAASNRFAMGADGRWHIGTFETATALGDGRYLLSDITLGLFNTGWLVIGGSPYEIYGLAGDAFAMLENADRVGEPDSIVGVSVKVRGVTEGTAFDNAVDVSFTARGNSKGFVTDFGTNTPPAHSVGATFVVGTAPTDDWAGKANYIAHDYYDAERGAIWVFEFPAAGRQVLTPSGETWEWSAGSPGRWVRHRTDVEISDDLDDLQDQVDGIDFQVNGIYEPLTNGNPNSPELIFLNGDVIMVKVNYGSS